MSDMRVVGTETEKILEIDPYDDAWQVYTKSGGGYSGPLIVPNSFFEAKGLDPTSCVGKLVVLEYKQHESGEGPTFGAVIDII